MDLADPPPDPDPVCEAMLPADLDERAWSWVPELQEACGPAHTDFVIAYAHGRTLALMAGALLLLVVFAHLVLVAFRVRGG